MPDQNWKPSYEELEKERNDFQTQAGARKREIFELKAEVGRLQALKDKQ